MLMPDNGLPLDVNMTDKQKKEVAKARRYAKYTYTVSKLDKEYTLLVNAILLNEINESVTFRSK